MRFCWIIFLIFWIIFWNNLRGSAWWGVSKDPSHRFCLAHFHPANLEDGSNLMSIFSIFFHLDDFFAWFTCTPKTYVKSTPRRSKNWRLSIVHRKSNCRTEPRPTFFFLMVGGGGQRVGLFRTMRHPGFVSTASTYTRRLQIVCHTRQEFTDDLHTSHMSKVVL